MATDPVEILNRRNAEVARIRGYADLTEEAKNRRITDVNERAQAKYAQAREAAARERAERLERSKRDVFRVLVSAIATDAEAAQLHTSYRAAFKHTYYATCGAESPAQAQEELQRLLGQAERTGDGLLARAAYHRGKDLGIQGVVEAYLAPRPAESRTWDAYTTAYREAHQAGSVEGLLGDGFAARAFSEAAG